MNPLNGRLADVFFSAIWGGSRRFACPATSNAGARLSFLSICYLLFLLVLGRFSANWTGWRFHNSYLGRTSLRVDQTTWVVPNSLSKSQYHRETVEEYSGNDWVPQIIESVLFVSGDVFVLCESFTAFAHAPRLSKRHSRPSSLIVCPAWLKT